jgi:hypothetical protein
VQRQGDEDRQEDQRDGLRIQQAEIDERIHQHDHAADRGDPAPPEPVGQVAHVDDGDEREQRLQHDEVQNRAAAHPELLRGVGDDVGGEDVELDLLTGTQERRQDDLAPIHPYHFDERRFPDSAARLEL